MKIKLSLLLAILLLGAARPQSSTGAAMGIGMVSMPRVHDYIMNVTPPDNQISTFESAIQFSAFYYYRYAPAWDFGVNLDYEIDSYSYDYSSLGSRYELSYNLLKPSVCAFRVFPGPGYQFRLGGGIGPRFVFVSEKPFNITNSNTGSAAGFGGFAAADAATMLSAVSYVYLGVNLQYDYLAAPKINGSTMKNTITGDDVTFSNFSAGIKIGVVFIF